MCFTFFFLSLSPSGKSPPSSLNSAFNSSSSSFLYAAANFYYFVAAAAVAAAGVPVEEDLPHGRFASHGAMARSSVGMAGVFL
jgi:hypothetical protein